MGMITKPPPSPVSDPSRPAKQEPINIMSVSVIMDIYRGFDFKITDYRMVVLADSKA